MIWMRSWSLLVLLVICNASFLKPTSSNVQTQNQAAIAVRKEVEDLQSELEIRCRKIKRLFDHDGPLGNSAADRLKRLYTGIDAKVQQHGGSMLGQLLRLKGAKKSLDGLTKMISPEWNNPTRIPDASISTRKTTLAWNPNQRTTLASSHSTATNFQSTRRAQDFVAATQDPAEIMVRKELEDLQHEMDVKSIGVRKMFGPEGLIGESRITAHLKSLFAEFDSQAHARGPLAVRLRMLKAAKKSFRNLSQAISAQWTTLARESSGAHKSLLLEVVRTLNEKSSGFLQAPLAPQMPAPVAGCSP
eukprot:TRINITY_DN29286_c0_g1_i1.p1 TRINITY_DN29286_c0_g1~~TRINITY_DN29286_c0_g1_i1.p1  ORF type:complete len:303 (+),score=49.08 TRINITY_DN29286_c0_g1_i1:63-971(+)